MLVRKVIRIGNSVAVTLPAGYASRLGWVAGMPLAIQLMLDEGRLVLTRVDWPESPVDPEVMVLTSELSQEHWPALQYLAQG